MMETYRGHVRSPADAIKLFEACRLGLLPRVQRRLSEKERQSITSGSVFVWDEREAGMRRWTDGKSWSASRVSGSFLTYREMEGKRGGGSFVPTPVPVRRMAGKTPDSGRGSDEDLDMDGEGPDGYRYKPDGLMKQSFSITTSSGQHLHLISYYARPHSNAVDLQMPTTDPALRHIVPAKGMYPESTVYEQTQGTAHARGPKQNPYMNSPQHMRPEQMAPGPLPPQGQRRAQPPVYPYNVAPSYGWPPSPVSTPPYNYQQNAYGSQLPPPPPGGSGHPSPHQYSPHPQHSGPPPPQQLQQPQTQFDRPPPSLQDSSLPPPPPSRHMSGSSSSSMPAPSYALNPSPRHAQARLVAEQQAQQAQRLSQQQQQMSMQAPPMAMIDPRITGAAPMAQPNGHPSQGPPPLANVDQGPAQPSSQPPVSQAQTIPSISSLVHASNVGDTPNESQNEREHPSRHGTASPKERGEENADGGRPQDIPHAKMGAFANEDMRTIRVLDRKFCI